MAELITGDFNYGSVDAETAAKLEYFAKSGKALIRKSQIQFIADFGKILSEARAVMSHHGDGKFVKWAIAEFDLSSKTIYNYVNAWDKCLCNGYTNYLNWSSTALYLLVSDDIPKPVQKRLQQLPATDLVRASDVKRLIEASKPKPDPDDDPPFDDVPTATPAEQAKATKEKEKAEAKAKKDKEKAEAKAKRDKEKEEAAAAKAKAKEQAKADAKAAKQKAREDAAAAKMAALPADEQARLLRSVLQQHIDRAVRLADDLHRVKKNQAKRVLVIKLLQDAGLNLWQ
jgi:hypothetical protein